MGVNKINGLCKLETNQRLFLILLDTIYTQPSTLSVQINMANRLEEGQKLFSVIYGVNRLRKSVPKDN